MRDHDDYEDHDDGYADRTSDEGIDALRTLALLGAVALIAAPAWKSMSRRWKVRHPTAMSEQSIDESLDETFPASDPPASRFVDIPENRK